MPRHQQTTRPALILKQKKGREHERQIVWKQVTEITKQQQQQQNEDKKELHISAMLSALRV